MTNQEFLNKVLLSFDSFIQIGTSRSTAKLKPLHGAIANDIHQRLGSDYIIKSQGYGDDKEAKIEGRYVEKWVDITVIKRRTNKPVAGIAVKFVMQNYSQNSNNYFENMLGETANIRTAKCPYFQIFIIFDKLPYYKKNGTISKWEELTNHNVSKYCKLSEDNIDVFYHTPNKTLIYIVHLTPEASGINTKDDYMSFYSENRHSISLTNNRYPVFQQGGSVIINDYESFVEKIYHTIMSI